ncbi:MAG: MFS transporter [Filifactoraceae bacterium]
MGIFCLAGFFANMEWPAYDALVADFTLTKDRERAYSLNYLGANFGMVLAPMIGGLLFANHLNWAFLISGLATFSSTVLIFFFIKDTEPVKEVMEGENYQEDSQESIVSILMNNKLMVLFLICTGISSFVYVQFNFLLPLNMEQLYGAEGAVIFGSLASVNAIVVIIATPILTDVAAGLRDTEKLIIGELLISLGFTVYIFMQGMVPMYFFSMVVFTLGEVVFTLGRLPYLTKRTPASHRGRMSSISFIFGGVAQGVAIKIVGVFTGRVPVTKIWLLVVIIGFINVCFYSLLRNKDKNRYPLLYKIED